MVPWLVLIAIVLAPSAVFLLWAWRSSRAEMALMRGTETTPAADVVKLPEGSVVEVKGRLRCAAPLTAELSKTPCAHFAVSVERDYEIVGYDANRKSSCRVRKTQLVQWSTMSSPFEIEDESGRATVVPENASVEGIAAINRYDVPEDDAGETAAGNHRTLGFRYQETHLPLDAEIYVLGVIGKDRCIGAPRPKAQVRASSSASTPRRCAPRRLRASADGCWDLACSALPAQCFVSVPRFISRAMV